MAGNEDKDVEPREYTVDDANFDIDVLSNNLNELKDRITVLDGQQEQMNNLLAKLAKAVSDYQIPIPDDLRQWLNRWLVAQR